MNEIYKKYVMNEKFKRGDIVKVWSLQSFHGGGFIDGRKGIVGQDQTGKFCSSHST